jgi:osmoprotectant transport system permease protein
MIGRRRRWADLCTAICLLMLSCATCPAATQIRVGSNLFTESVILGEMATQLGTDGGFNTIHRSQLGATRVLWEALLHGDIDVFPEYTGIISLDILPGTPLDEGALHAALAKYGVGMTEPLGFNDTYGIAMTDALATKLNVQTIEDLCLHPELRMGFSNEFLERKDGWLAARAAYNLPQTNIAGLDHNLAYRAIASGKCDVVDVYSTEPEIASYRLRVLEDNKKGLFADYKAVYLYRLDLKQREPGFIEGLRRLEGAIDERQMIALNEAAKMDRTPEAQIAADFLFTRFRIRPQTQRTSVIQDLLLRTREHLWLVGISLLASVLMALPLGVAAYEWPGFGHAILTAVAVINTIPPLALLVFMIPLLGIGSWPAIVALFLYGLLPIVRNTHSGLEGIPPSLRESAIVLGLSPKARLIKIELPLASQSILAGIKTTAVIDVGVATIGALIGAGGYGQPILTGIRLGDNALILRGAIPAAILAILVQSSFGLLERILVPRGLRLKRPA